MCWEEKKGKHLQNSSKENKYKLHLLSNTLHPSRRCLPTEPQKHLWDMVGQAAEPQDFKGSSDLLCFCLVHAGSSCCSFPSQMQSVTVAFGVACLLPGDIRSFIIQKLLISCQQLGAWPLHFAGDWRYFCFCYFSACLH